MRRKVIIPIVMVAAVIALLVGVLVVPAHGGAKTGTTVAKTTVKGATVRSVTGLLQPIVMADQGVTNGQAHYSLVVKPTMATSGGTASPSPLAGLLSNGVTVSGIVKADAKAKSVDATVDVALGNGSTMLSGEVYWSGNKGWVKYNDTWYSLPPQALRKLQQAEAKHHHAKGSAKEAKDAAAAGLLTKLGIDPQKWLSGLTVTGPDSTTGLTEVSSGFDVKQIASDAVKLFESPQVQKRLNKVVHHMGAQRMAKMNGKFRHAMSAAQLAQVPDQAAAVITDPTAALWVDSGKHTFNKFEAGATIVPPAAAKAPVSSVKVDLTIDNISLGTTSISNPVSNPQPWSHLQKAIQGLQKMFPGITKH